MITIQDLTKKKAFPRWMVTHPVFQSLGKIEKVFPNIGLPNCSEPCDIVGNFAIEEAKKLLSNIASEIRAPLDALAANNHIDLVSVIGQLDSLFCDRLDDFICYSKDEIVLKLPEAIVINDTVKYAKHAPLFNVYENCRVDFSRCGWMSVATEKIPGYKDFITNNVSSKHSTIVFSSDGVDGLWDIATMSMRGIKSCIRWDGPHKLTLIGSMADPFTGVIYLTSGKKCGKYGTRMIKRCVVRFVVDGEKEKPYLLIDRMYPSISDNVLNTFSKFLTSKSGLEVYFGPNIPKKIINSSYIPRRPINDKLTEKTLTYRDTKVPIGKMQSKVSERKDLNIKVKEHNLAFKLKAATSADRCLQRIENTDTALFFRGTADFQYLIGGYSTSLIAQLSERCKPEENQSSSEHIKQMCYLFFSDKKAILKRENDKFIRGLKKYFGKQSKTVITQTLLKPMFDYIAGETKKVLKAELIKIISPEDLSIKKSKTRNVHLEWYDYEK